MNIGLQNHGDILPDSFFARECDSCGEARNDLNKENLCPSCAAELSMTDVSTSSPLSPDGEGVERGAA